MLDILVQTRNASSGIKAATPDLLKKKTELCTHTQTEHADTREPATASWEKTHHGNTEVGPLFRRQLNKEGGKTTQMSRTENIHFPIFENRKSFRNYTVLANPDFWVTKQKVKANFPKYCKIYCISIAAFRMTYNCHYRLLLHNKRLQQIFVNWHQSTYSY